MTIGSGMATKNTKSHKKWNLKSHFVIICVFRGHSPASFHLSISIPLLSLQAHQR